MISRTLRGVHDLITVMSNEAGQAHWCSSPSSWSLHKKSVRMNSLTLTAAETWPGELLHVPRPNPTARKRVSQVSFIYTRISMCLLLSPEHIGSKSTWKPHSKGGWCSLTWLTWHFNPTTQDHFRGDTHRVDHIVLWHLRLNNSAAINFPRILARVVVEGFPDLWFVEMRRCGTDR